MAVAAVAVCGQGISLLTNVLLEQSKRQASRGDLVAAVESANMARKLQPWAASPYFQRGLVQEDAGALRRARNSLDEAIERAEGLAGGGSVEIRPVVDR
jgi:Flp pilus assembly protein TadD